MTNENFVDKKNIYIGSNALVFENTQNEYGRRLSCLSRNWTPVAEDNKTQEKLWRGSHEMF